MHLLLFDPCAEKKKKRKGAKFLPRFSGVKVHGCLLLLAAGALFLRDPFRRRRAWSFAPLFENLGFNNKLPPKHYHSLRRSPDTTVMKKLGFAYLARVGSKVEKGNGKKENLTLNVSKGI